VKNRCKSAEEAKTEHLLKLISSFKLHFSDRNELDKVEIIGGSNNAGVWGRSPAVFYILFFKKYASLSILWSIFLL